MAKTKQPEYGTNWNDAVKRCGIFFSDKVVITMICEERLCECEENVIPKPLHYVVSEKKKNSKGKASWQIVSTHALKSDKQKAWGKYGLPNEFAIAFGYFKPGEVVINRNKMSLSKEKSEFAQQLKSFVAVVFS